MAVVAVVVVVAAAYPSLLAQEQWDGAFESMLVMKIKLMSNNYVSFHHD